jgi:hypothetical protein
MSVDPVERIRALSLSSPEFSEKEAWAEATFRVRDNLFAQVEDNHHNSGRLALWCKAKPGLQEILVETRPDRYFRPPYVGHRGWVGILLRPEPSPEDWEEIEDLIDDAYRLTAPKRVLALLDAQ